jgi:3-keto-disaccharide hydrolase
MSTAPAPFGTIVALLSAMFLATAAQAEPPANEPGWKSMFDGKTLQGWKKTAFGGEGDVAVKDARLVIATGSPMSGITWTGEFPKIEYEISLEAMRVDGSDFFCGLTFPVGDSPCSFIVGGWGGGVVGLSSIDGSDASENETTKYQEFKSGEWHTVRVRVSKDKIEAWLDKKQMVDLPTKDRRISIRPEVELSRPLGISTYATTAALREIKVRRLGAEPKK